MKKFKTKKNKKYNFIIYIGIFFISIAFSTRYLIKEELINENTLIDSLMNGYLNETNYNLFDSEFLFKYTFNRNLLENEVVLEETNNEEKVEILEDEPLVYIYNTHQTEKYKSGILETYNVSSTVLIASKILKEYLEDLGIKVIVEEDNVADKLNSLNWKYGSSYKVSRMFMEDAKRKYPSLKYFIDLHRDSSNYEKTTTEINGEKYVKILFVVGLDNKNYEPNLKLVEDLSDILKSYNGDLYRGIMKKSGKGVNGIYNQDFSANTMLIEVGGQYNNISEVNNTLKIFSKVLYDYIKENLNA